MINVHNAKNSISHQVLKSTFDRSIIEEIVECKNRREGDLAALDSVISISHRSIERNVNNPAMKNEDIRNICYALYNNWNKKNNELIGLNVSKLRKRMEHPDEDDYLRSVMKWSGIFGCNFNICNSNGQKLFELMLTIDKEFNCHEALVVMKFLNKNGYVTRAKEHNLIESWANCIKKRYEAEERSLKDRLCKALKNMQNSSHEQEQVLGAQGKASEQPSSEIADTGVQHEASTTPILG